MQRNIKLYPWYRFLRNLSFYQAVWFLYFQSNLSAAEAILLYAIYDITTTVLEVPSGYLSDRYGRRLTLIFSALAGLAGAVLLWLGNGFGAFALGQALLGAHAAFASGTDTSLYYESLAAEGREEEVEAGEVIAWRYSFTGLALSAFLGGGMALIDPVLPFVATALAFVALLVVTLLLKEPTNGDAAPTSETLRLAHLWAALKNPVLAWLFAIGVLMYGFSHIPFVFGQPFIAEALETAGYRAEAPLVSGIVTAAMMLLSVLVSLGAPALRKKTRLELMLLFAFGLQIGIAVVLATTNAPWIILVLLLRMVPDALSTPFIVARIQPLLEADSRATFLSLKSLTGRLLFAASLWAAAISTTDAGAMPYEDIQTVLWTYAAFGFASFAALALEGLAAS